MAEADHGRRRALAVQYTAHLSYGKLYRWQAANSDTTCTAYFGAVLIFSSTDTVDGGNYSDIARKIDQYNTFTKPPPNILHITRRCPP